MDIKERILVSINHLQARGFTLIREGWGDPKAQCACPMACVILEGDLSNTIDGDFPEENIIQASGLLGRSPVWVQAFIDGWDGYLTANQSSDPEAWKLGEQMCVELEPKVYADFYHEQQEGISETY
jgi:hypothetical protein